jgi:septum formation protein
MELVLASQSPRRRDLLNQHGFSFHVFPVKVSEIIDENLNPEANATGLSTLKARAAVEQHNLLKQNGFLVLGADTIVILGGRILGKPENRVQACEFLRSMSGKMHSVITGLTLLQSGRDAKIWVGSDETKVYFHTLSEAEIQEYVATGEADDKAGAYGMQGEGKKFVSSYSGSWSNVVGLPMELLVKALRENAWNVSQRSP